MKGTKNEHTNSCLNIMLPELIFKSSIKHIQCFNVKPLMHIISKWSDALEANARFLLRFLFLFKIKILKVCH